MKKTYIKPDSIIKEPRLLLIISGSGSITGGNEHAPEEESAKERTIWVTEEPANESIWNF